MQAPRDENGVPSLLGVSSSDGLTPVTVYVDPTSHRMLVSGSGGGATTFLALTDAPDSYAGQAFKVVQVNAGETGLEFVALAGGGDALTANPLSQFAATTSAQLAGVITNETGSGSLVFATSPTLVTPALGTPTALVLTNATGLPIAGIAASGTPDNTTFLRGDGTWDVPVGGSGDMTEAVYDPANVNEQLVGLTSTQTITNKNYSGFDFDGLIMYLGAASADTGYLVFRNDANANEIDFSAGSTSASYSLVLPLAQGGANTFLKNDGSGNLSWAAGGGGGATDFTDLGDVPSSYSGESLKVVRVNAGETALEFVTLAGGGDALTTDPLSQFAATTSSQLAGVISDETGSGALVFATSPTLVTPNLGTPSAVVLTNATGTAAGLTAGTASAVAVGGITGLGSGVATFLATPSSANLAAAVTGETGSGALVFGTSPTLATPVINVGSDATGDIYYRNSGGLFTRLAAGTDGHVLTLASGIPSWAAGGGGGLSWGASISGTTPDGVTLTVSNSASASVTGLNVTVGATQANADVGGIEIDISTSGAAYGMRVLGTGSLATTDEDKHLVLWGNTSSNSSKVLSIGNGTTFSETIFMRADGRLDISAAGNNALITLDGGGGTALSSQSFIVATGNGTSAFTGKFLNVSLASTSATTARTNAFMDVAYSQTVGTAVTVTHNYDFAKFVRTSVGSAGTFNAQGSVGYFQNVATPSGGTLNDTVTVIRGVQDADSTGDLMELLEGATERFVVEKAGTVDISGIAAGTPNLKVTATSDTPTTTWTAGVTVTDPSGFIEILDGANVRYIPFYA